MWLVIPESYSQGKIQIIKLNLEHYNSPCHLIELLIGTVSFNPFAPEPPVTARADPGPFYPLWRHQF